MGSLDFIYDGKRLDNSDENSEGFPDRTSDDAALGFSDSTMLGVSESSKLGGELGSKEGVSLGVSE